MVTCKQCATLNSLDSTFCKKCGTALPEEDLAQAMAKLDAVVAEGVILFSAGKVREAMEVAETSVASNPSSVSALALKGDCHAQLGQIAEAIECYERIVELHPDSTLDKLRLNQLRNQIVLQANPAPPDKRVALAGGLATVVLVVCIAAIWARTAGMAKAEARNAVAQNQLTVDPSQPQSEFYENGTNQAGGNAADGQQAPAATQNSTTAQRQPPATNSTPQTSDEPVLPPTQGTTLPQVKEGITGLETEVRPVTPTISGNIGRPDTTSPTRNTNSATPSKSAEHPDDPVTVVQPETAPRGDGYIDIRVMGRGDSLPGGAQSTSKSTTPVLLQVARQQYMLGNYSGAVGAYERALNEGADPISTNQRLGQSYERLGRVGDATAAYTKAISAVRSAISGGRGDKDRLQTIEESCRQALKVLQGN